MSKTPCIVITRDRVSFTRLCVSSLERFSDRLDIHLVDHGSTWPEMLEYLGDSPHMVHGRGDYSPRELWQWSGLQDIVGGLGGRPYLVTDPDVVFDDGCPTDWLEQLYIELYVSGGRFKVGLGLRLDDLPDTELATRIRTWEMASWSQRTSSGNAWRAPVDTTLALYPGLGVAPDFQLGPAARLDAPYLLRHLPWYGNLDQDEADYYRTRLLPGSSHWTELL